MVTIYIFKITLKLGKNENIGNLFGCLAIVKEIIISFCHKQYYMSIYSLKDLVEMNSKVYNLRITSHMLNWLESGPYTEYLQQHLTLPNSC